MQPSTEKTNLHVSLLQNDLVWEDIPANLRSFDRLFEKIDGDVDVIILPEMFSTGFSNHSNRLAVHMDSTPVQWMKDHAANFRALVMGSMIIEEKGHFFNRLIAAFPDGNLQTYDKRHLFSLMQENHHYKAGYQRLLIEYKGWRIMPFICYDLRFPVWCRNTEMADLMVFVANWPEKRSFHWTTLLQARAIENQCFVAGVNRIGTDNQGNLHHGQSAVYDFWGKELVSASDLRTAISIRLSASDLEAHRERFTFWKDRDTFDIQ
jgi:omega-amidase